MAARICAVLSLIALPISAGLWYTSHSRPEQHRFDLTLYQCVWLYLSKGVCALEVISLPRKTPARSEFRASFNHKVLTRKGNWAMSSRSMGSYRSTWLVFPLWLPTTLLALVFSGAMLHGPARSWWRKRTGRCIPCGYSLYGNRTGRCPECGESLDPGRKS